MGGVKLVFVSLPGKGAVWKGLVRAVGSRAQEVGSENNVRGCERDGEGVLSGKRIHDS